MRIVLTKAEWDAFTKDQKDGLKNSPKGEVLGIPTAYKSATEAAEEGDTVTHYAFSGVGIDEVTEDTVAEAVKDPSQITKTDTRETLKTKYSVTDKSVDTKGDTIKVGK